MIKHILWVFLATILLGTLVMELPLGVPRLSTDGLAIAIGGPLALCFLPALIISLIISVIYYLTKKSELLAFKYFIWGVWAIPAFLMLLGAISSNANADSLIEDAKSGLVVQKKGEYWTNKTENIGAFFPSKPEFINLSSSVLSAKRYFSLKQYSEGTSQFSITLIPLDNHLKSHREQKQFLEATAKSQATSAGAINDTIKRQWSTFSDGRPQLYYEFLFLEQGYPVSTRGFYVADGKRIINVSVLYLSTLPPIEEREVTSFLGTFVLIEQ